VNRKFAMPLRAHARGEPQRLAGELLLLEARGMEAGELLAIH
jgi:hypothetical protein